MRGFRLRIQENVVHVNADRPRGEIFLMELTALLFDVDGTLAETEEIHRQCFNAAFEEFDTGWVWDRPLYTRLLEYAGGRSRLHHYAAMEHPAFYSRPGSKDLVQEIHLRKVELYVQRIQRREVELRPGVRRLIAEARSAGLRLAIVTSSSPQNVAPLLESTIGEESLGWFEVVAAGNCVEYVKPSPDIYRWTLRKMALDPASCLAFEDSGNGLRSAVTAGIGTIVTATAYTDHDDFTGATAVLSDLGEPDHPFRMLAGDAHGQSCVSVDLLRRWHADRATCISD